MEAQVALLAQAGVGQPRLDAQLLLAHVLGTTREQLLLETSIALSPAQQHHFEQLIARRIAREPVAQILGRREFWGLDFKVTKDTLDPRPDSETIIERLLIQQPGRSRPLRILDLGTGTGCLLLAALSEYPAARGLGVDRSEQALEVARYNAEALGLKNRAEFEKSDWNNGINGVWDVVISNPPYIPTEEIPRLAPEVAQHEPHGALDGGRDGLDCYRTISRMLPSLLSPEGIALFEVGEHQAAAVAQLAVNEGLRIAEVASDLAGIARCVVVRK